MNKKQLRLKLNEEVLPNENCEIISEGTTQKLIIKNAQKTDKGAYSINASNKAGKAQSKCDVSIHYAPELKTPLKDIEILQKKTAILEAEVDALPLANVEWFKNNQKIDTSSTVYENRYSIIERKGGIYQLQIKTCKQEDSGDYKCVITNKVGQVESGANLNVISGPAFIKKFDQVDGVENCEIRINVEIAVTPRLETTWSKNTNQIDTNLKDKYEIIDKLENGKLSQTLIIKNASKNDAGQYQCVATNDAGRTICLGKVSVHPLTPPKFTVPLKKELIFPENKQIELTVKASGIPVPKIKWFKNESEISEDGKDYSIEENLRDGTYKLKANSISTDYSGFYKVVAQNPAGETITETNLTIKGTAPFIINKPEKITCLEDSIAILGCSFDGEPQAKVTWSLKNKTIKNNDKYIIKYDKENKSSILEIKGCTKEDEGTYTITIENIHGVENVPVTMIVTKNAEDVQDYTKFLKAVELEKKVVEEEKPDWGKLKEGAEIEKPKPEEEDKIKLKKIEILPEFIRCPNDISTIIEKEAKFEAEVKSSKKVTVRWFIDAKEIKSREGIRVEKDEPKNKFSLTIRRVTKEFEGTIRCVASNEDGEVEKTCKLKIIGN